MADGSPAEVTNSLVERMKRNDAANKDLRSAFNVLGPLIRDLPRTDDLLLGDAATVAWRTLRDGNPELYMVYRSLVRVKCGKHVTDLLDSHIGPPVSVGLHDHPVRAISATDLAGYELPILASLLDPWLMEKTLCMVHAKRGVGKTHLMVAIALAVATGGNFLNWSAPKPQGVIYIDGEMQAQAFQQRIKDGIDRVGMSPDLLQIVTPDLQEAAMPDMGTIGGQRAIDALVSDKTKLIIVDNLSCLVRSGGAENESESWGAVSEWALKHRREGRAVMFVHHSGKSGAQRGTSKREDLLDVVINLKRPTAYNESDGAVFIIEFEKARALKGGDIAAIEARLETLPNGLQDWTYRPVEAVNQRSIADLWNGGAVTLMDVARELGMNKSSVHRHLEKSMADGQLTRPYPTPRARK